MEYSADLRVLRAKETYTRELIDSDSAPDLHDLAEKFNIDVPTLRRVSREENWEEIRRNNRSTLLAEIDYATNNELSKVVIDVAKVRSELLQQTYGIVKQDINKVHAEIQNRISEMDDKTLISYLSLLVKISGEVQKTIESATQAVKEQESSTKDFWDKLVENPDVVDMIRSKTVINADTVDIVIQEDAERKKAFSKLDNRD